ncbi:CRISPR-associated Csm3 family protein [Thermoflavifilum aggregans]|uniref:CRISPR system Cms endoribonuclease Csm3 n=1 Tax=Thermoflavifilum aggregans TaxID=454188 RepID=A0A2M9CUW7_9BACT|nr:type III-A CRISPR-associated RAMP protein Csm3 [Thermoflavifilum aggregans]PJJ75598.1 CRISPR-associated Csm3 family protein [Thermoflavifilum aggregans]
MRLYKKLIFKGTLELLTGLHIGDSKEKLEIGGVDSPVVRRKDNNQPYIPGSSLKGKIRSLLEISQGVENTFEDPSNPIGRLFGALSRSGTAGNPSRLIVRDAYLTKDSAEAIATSEYTDMPYTEIKFENKIDRIRGVAEHPRQIERVPAGSRFDVEFIINVVGNDEQEAEKNENEFLGLLQKGIKLLECDYLGGSGSRGYGKVKLAIDWDKPEVVNIVEMFGNPIAQS